MLKTQRIIPQEGQKFPPERDNDITASVCGALFGESDYTTYWQLWQRHARGMLGQPAGKLARFGTVLEEGIAALLEAEHGCVLEKERGYIRCPEYRIGASLDYWCYKWEDNHCDTGIPLDCKLVSQRAWSSKWDRGETIPTQYVMQLQMQCGLTGTDRGLLGLLVAGEDTRIFEVPFSPDLFKSLLNRVEDFWASIKEGREPLSHPEVDAEDLLRIHRRIEPGTFVDLTTDNQASELCAEYQRLKEISQHHGQIAGEAEKQMRIIKAALFEKMKTHATARVGDFFITTKTVDRKGYTAQPSSYRTFTLEAK